MIDNVYIDIIKKHNKLISIIPPEKKPVIKKLKNIKIILFDVYGTLLNSNDKIYFNNFKIDKIKSNKLIVFIKENKLNSNPEELVLKYLKEIENTNDKSKIKNEFPEVNIIKIWSVITGIKDFNLLKKIALEFEVILNNSSPLGDINNLFDFLKKKKIIMGIISNAQFYTQIILEYFLGKDLHDAGFKSELLFYSYKYRTAKPSEKIFNKVKDKINGMGFNAENVLFIGNDINNDIIPAQKVGFKTALFSGDKRFVSTGYSLNINPDLVLTNWQEIEEIII